ncbi:hypothetical protein IJV79_00455, partial [bacterium]|nr:hypothetical protein [bacterium]
TAVCTNLNGEEVKQMAGTYMTKSERKSYLENQIPVAMNDLYAANQKIGTSTPPASVNGDYSNVVACWNANMAPYLETTKIEYENGVTVFYLANGSAMKPHYQSCDWKLYPDGVNKKYSLYLYNGSASQGFVPYTNKTGNPVAEYSDNLPIGKEKCYLESVSSAAYLETVNWKIPDDYPHTY